MRRLLAASLVWLATLGTAPASASDIKVLTAGAFKPVVMALVPGFEKETGDKVVVANDTVGALVRRIEGGEAFDVALLSPDAIDRLSRAGKVDGGSATRLARVGIGVAVKSGAPLPDIASVAAFRKTLLAARAVAYIDPGAGGSSGIYLAHLFATLGIAGQVKAKAVLVPGGLVATRVVDGEADIGIHQMSEILAVPGATLVGPIPAEIQNYTVYAGAIASASREAGASWGFLKRLAGPDTASVLKKKGMESPG